MNLDKKTIGVDWGLEKEGAVKCAFSWKNFIPHITFFGFIILLEVILFFINPYVAASLLGIPAYWLKNPYFVVSSVTIGLLVWRQYLFFILIIIMSIIFGMINYYDYYSFMTEIGAVISDADYFFGAIDDIVTGLISALFIGYIVNALSLYFIKRPYLIRKQAL